MLEIGVGNRTVSNYLKENGVDITTFDFDKELKPDIVGDVRDMKGIKDNSFDVVMACEVLEHIPFDDVEYALKELKRVSSKYVIVSLPQYGWSFNINLVIPFLDRLTKKRFLNIGFFIPRFYSNVKFDGQHYWEIGCKDYSLKRVRELFSKYFNVEDEFEVELNRFHRFFVLKK